MGYKFTTILFCCIFVFSATVVSALSEQQIVYISKEAPDKVFTGSEFEYFTSVNYYARIVGFATNKPCVLIISYEEVYPWDGSSNFKQESVYFPTGFVSPYNVAENYYAPITKLYVALYYINSMRSKGSPVVVRYGPSGVAFVSRTLYSWNTITEIITNPSISLGSTSEVPAGVSVSSGGFTVQPGTTGDFSIVYNGIDSTLQNPIPVTVNVIYDGTLKDPVQDSQDYVPGTPVKTNDGRSGVIHNKEGDVITNDGTIVGINNSNNPNYNPVASGGSNTTVPSDTIKPSDSTPTTTENDTPSYDGDDSDTGAVVGAVGALSDNMTNSLNNLSSDVTNALNALSNTDADGFNGVIGSLNNLIDSANTNAALERNKLQELIDAVKDGGDDEEPEDPGEPPDLIVSDKTTNKPSFLDLFASVAGFDVDTSSPPVFHMSLPRLGGLSPQLLTLDFASIPFLDYFPLVRLILAWTLIIFTFKHIFQIFTLGS